MISLHSAILCGFAILQPMITVGICSVTIRTLLHRYTSAETVEEKGNKMDKITNSSLVQEFQVNGAGMISGRPFLQTKSQIY
jgi:hypothetical protein